MGKTIDFEWYKVFYEVALRGSVSGAAADLAVSQPAVSQSIRNLEQAFGVRLFHRRSRGVELTDTGRRLYSYVRESYRLLKLGERSVREFLDLSAGSLLIGAPDDLGTYLLTPLFKEFRTEHPAVVLRTVSAVDRDIIEDVAGGELDAGFVSLPTEIGSLGVVPLMEFRDLLVAGSPHASLSVRPLSPEELIELPLAVPAKGSSARRNLEEYLSLPSDWNPVFESNSPEAIRRFAAAGLGIGYLLEEALAESYAAEGLTRLEAAEPPPSRRICFIFRTDVELSEAARSMYDLVLKFATGQASSPL